MQLRIGYELIYSFPQPTPIILVVNIHDSRASDIVVPDRLTAEPSIPITGLPRRLRKPVPPPPRACGPPPPDDRRRNQR